MAEHLLGERQVQRHEHGGPDDGVKAHDLLADEMDIRRPVFLIEAVVLRAVSEGGDIVRERIHPDIDDMLRVECDRHAPGKRRAGHAQVFQTGLDKVIKHLIAAGGGLQKLRMLLKKLDQLILIFGKAKKIRLLGRAPDLAPTVRALDVDELRLRPEGFAGRAVPALIGALVDIALVIELLEDFLNGLLMIIVRRADEFIIGSVHQIPNPLNLSGCLVHKFLGSHTGCLSLFLNLLSMLVRTCLEEHVISLLPLISGYAVSQNDFIGIADMRLAGSIGNGRGNIIWLFTILTHMINSLFF